MDLRYMIEDTEGVESPNIEFKELDLRNKVCLSRSIPSLSLEADLGDVHCRDILARLSIAISTCMRVKWSLSSSASFQLR